MLLPVLAEVPAQSTSLALMIEPGAGDAEVRCLVRVAAPPAQLAGACQHLVEAATRSGVELFRLDGEQLPAVYATAPTGGGAR